MKFQHLKRWATTAHEALSSGGDRRSFATIRWNVAGNCQSPVHREYYGSEAISPRLDGTGARGRGVQMTLEFEARCRTCPACLKARAAHWRYKCIAEIKAAPRTWFATFTFSPENVYRAKCAAHLRLAARGVAWSEASEADQFRALAQELGKDTTRYFKRLRKAGAEFRYCLVAEAHKSGVPHYHALIHEVSDTSPVRHKLLAEKWDAGFSNIKLASDHRVAHYVCKYLTKSMRARIRASTGYGIITSLDIPTTLGEKVSIRNVDLQRKKTQEIGPTPFPLTDHREGL